LKALVLFVKKLLNYGRLNLPLSACKGCGGSYEYCCCDRRYFVVFHKIWK
jgi:hypothetical protein